jgi:5-methylcytosine-specific restriction enzyme A
VLRPCSTHGCPVLVPRGHCEAHQVKRITGRKLQQIRRSLFRERPFCEACGVSVAVVVDHIRALVNGGLDEPTNRAALCRECHRIKTQDDLGYARRG